MGNTWTINDSLDEVERLYKEGHSLESAIEIVKGYCSDQTNNNHRDKLTDIIAPGENIDNGRIYSEATGEIDRDLI